MSAYDNWLSEPYEADARAQAVAEHTCSVCGEIGNEELCGDPCEDCAEDLENARQDADEMAQERAA